MKVLRFNGPAELAKTYRELARERHNLAVDRLLAGDHDAWSAYRKDADLFLEQAREEETRLSRIKRQVRDRSGQVRAINWILTLAREGH